MQRQNLRVVRAFDNIVQKRCAVKPGEHVLIVADVAQSWDMIDGLMNAVTRAGAIFTVAIGPNGGWAEADPYKLTKPIEKGYEGADLIIGATLFNGAAVYGRPQAYRDMLAAKKNTRFFSVMERPLSCIVQDADVNYDDVAKNCEKAREVIQKGKTVRMTSKRGTDITAEVFIPSSGFPMDCYHPGTSKNYGDFASSPDGEVHWAPPYHTINGTVVVDGPVANVCDQTDPDVPVTITIRKGRITGIEGGRDARKLRDFITKIHGDYISEFGMGTNPVRFRHRGLQTQKEVLGNVHVAYGGWWGHQDQESIVKTRGPNRIDEAIPTKIHGDMVSYQARYEVDGRVIMENGKLTI